jgi:Uncharacterised protein family (UPF0183)
VNLNSNLILISKFIVIILVEITHMLICFKQLFRSDHLNSNPVVVNAYTKWDSICSKLEPSDCIVLHRSSSTNCSNIFGSTFCYGFQDIIFEIMNNGHIGSVTFYNTSQNGVFSNWSGII